MPEESGGSDGVVDLMAEDGIASQIFGGGLSAATPSDDTENETDPNKLRSADFYGWKAKDYGVAAYGDSILHLNTIVADYPRDIQYPASYRIAAFDPSCTPRPPREDEAIANVSVGFGDRPSGLLAFDTSELVKAQMTWLGRKFGGTSVTQSQLVPDRDGMAIIDVIVTDTSAPQYLVLQHWMSDVLWNVMLAPGVEVSHIAVVGPGGALNPPWGDYDIQFLSTRGIDCVPRVARIPRPSWGMTSQPGAETLAQDYMDESRTAYDHYAAWFLTHFNSLPEFNVVGFYVTKHALVGPVPDTPIPYRPLAGAEVLVTEKDYIFVSEPQVRDAFLLDVQIGLLTDAAGGDLAALSPEPMLSADTATEVVQ
ncbi:hypothetical protein [Psychromarinibacter halotolerans]|uniref:Uncharacterized protein n=2 Tax=Psychromarinibacter halotolerans TaxID=1775175 RepID=A0ABV7GJS6_9RHOB|nr:hypothetical protein [Psychromarinibacter halotolerans]MDF0595718.1 hypothetical protein [Psychromarinibacter halotolerans]